MLADEALCRHRLSYNLRECDTYVLPNPGYYHWRKGGEKHINDPDNIASLQVSRVAGWLGRPGKTARGVSLWE